MKGDVLVEHTVREMADNIAGLMEKRLRIGGHGLPAKLKRAGRLLPRRRRRDAQAVADALPMAESARLAKRIDLARLQAAERRVTAYLKGVDPRQRRIDMALRILGGIALGLLAATALFVGVLVWQDLI